MLKSVMFCLLFTGSILQAADLESILEQVGINTESTEREIRDKVYIANSTFTEWRGKEKTEPKKVTTAERRVYEKQPGLMHMDYLWMRVDGKLLSAKEMERELKKQRTGGRPGGAGNSGQSSAGGSAAEASVDTDKGDGPRAGRNPFHPELRTYYHFTLIGERQFQGIPVWEISFEPQEPHRSLADGFAYISQADYQVVYLDLTPSKLPAILKQMSFRITFSPVEGYWLPRDMLMEMDLKVQFLVKLADRTMTFEDHYSAYHLNSGLSDDLFVD